MKFGLFYQHQALNPYEEGTELRVYQQALDQVELADKLGFDCVWETEHHFLEEYSHSSAPEVFLAAASQRTRNIHLGHAVMLMSPRYNHPVRSAERVAVLDLVSNGRVEWGTGEGASALELGGFNIPQSEKTEMWQEATEQAANMLAMTPYPGFQGKYFSMPCRNVVPKPKQRPHPPMWVACSRRETIHRAAQNGLGALGFAFVEPEQAAKWVEDYYAILKTDACVPLSHSVNPNLALVLGLSIHENEDEAIRRGLDGFRFLGYALGYVANYGRHIPGRSRVFEQFKEALPNFKDTAGRGGIGTPDQVREVLRRYEKIGVDQIIFAVTCGETKHEHICESLEIFAKSVMPEFKDRDAKRVKQKEADLAPHIAAAMKRKKYMLAIKDGDIPVVESFGLNKATAVGVSHPEALSDRGGGITVPSFDPRLVKK